MDSARAGQVNSQYCMFSARNTKGLTRRQIEHGRARVDNIRVLCGVCRLVPSHAVGHNRVERVLPRSFGLANKICLEHHIQHVSPRLVVE